MKRRKKIISSFLVAFILFEIISMGNIEKSAYAYSTINQETISILNAPKDNGDDSSTTLPDESVEDSEDEIPDVLPDEIPDSEVGQPESPEDDLEENIPEDSNEDEVEEEVIHKEEEEIIPEQEENDDIDESLDMDEFSEGGVKANDGLNAWEDLNKDGVVNNKDVEIAASQYNSMRNQAGYDEVSDLNYDGIIDLYDMVKVSKWVGSDTKPPVGPRKIVIDPGHGGSDSGAVGPNGIREKDIVLKVGLKVRDILKSKGYIVIMTRDGDYRLSETLKIDLEKRAQIANDNNADIFVSIHNNSASTPAANGTETFIYEKESSGSMAWQLADSIQRKLISTIGLYNRGIKWADFSVLRNTKMPAALTELAFINNPKEEALLNTNEFQDKAARAIAEGIMSLTK